MNTNDLQALEGYFKTENDHWNYYTRKMLYEVMEQGIFENPETPLKLFSIAVNNLPEMYETPLQAVQSFETETDLQELEPVQRLFVLQWVLKYFKNSEFDQNTDEIQDFLQIKINNLDNEIIKPEYKPLTRTIRETLKDLMQKELEQLPETLKELEPVQRLNVICKLIPFVLPKVESVTHTLGEPGTEKKGWFD